MSFLQKLVQNKLPVSLQAHEFTRNILYIEDFYEDWRLYGKTGCGNLKEAPFQLGWFVGWIVKDNQIIYFANYIEVERQEDCYASMVAKNYVKQKMLDLVKNID